MPFFRRPHPAHLGLLCLFVTSIGCVSALPALPRTAAPRPTQGYVGGVFQRDTIVGFGLGLRNLQTGIAYVIAVADQAMSLVTVPPGRYRLESWMTWAALTHEQITRKDIPYDSAYAQPFDIDPGEVVLLGSWFADRIIGFGRNTFTIQTRPITEGEAIGALKIAYPGFANQSVRCVFCPN